MSQMIRPITMCKKTVIQLVFADSIAYKPGSCRLSLYNMSLIWQTADNCQTNHQFHVNHHKPLLSRKIQSSR